MRQFKFELETLTATRDGEHGAAEPYLWTVFVLLDGTSVTTRLMADGTIRLVGTPQFRFGLGSHGNVVDEIRTGETVDIPPTVGLFVRDATPIRTTNPFDGSAIVVEPIVACLMLLMEENAVTDDGAEAGHRAFNSFVVSSVNSFLAGIDFLSLFLRAGGSQNNIINLLRADLAAFATGLVGPATNAIVDAIIDEQSAFENLASAFDRDDLIGSPQTVAFSAAHLSGTPTTFSVRMFRPRGGVSGGASLITEPDPPDYMIRGTATFRERIPINQPPLDRRLRISCVSTISTRHFSRVVSSIGGTHEGQPWRMSRAFAAQCVLGEICSFYVEEDGHTTDVHVVRPDDGGEPFLRTDPDTTTDNNLLSLPSCVFFVDEL